MCFVCAFVMRIFFFSFKFVMAIESDYFKSAEKVHIRFERKDRSTIQEEGYCLERLS